MAGTRRAGSLGTDTNSPTIDRGTSARTESPLPGTVCVTRNPETLRNEWQWGGWQAARWKLARWKVLPSWLGGDPNLLRNYKDSWVVAHKKAIIRYAAMYHIPSLLLAGVAWSEVGGDPDWVDPLGYSVRTKFNQLGKPELTSFGDVQIQLRRVAEMAGVDFNQLSPAQQEKLIECLSDEESNLELVAKHLAQLKNIDFRKKTVLGDEEIRIIGARYNRGSELTLAQIKQNTSYGDFILSRKSKLLKLLK